MDPSATDRILDAHGITWPQADGFATASGAASASLLGRPFAIGRGRARLSSSVHNNDSSDDDDDGTALPSRAAAADMNGFLSPGALMASAHQELRITQAAVDKDYLSNEVKRLKKIVEQGRTDQEMLMRQLKDSQAHAERLQAELRVSQKNEKRSAKDLTRSLEEERKRVNELNKVTITISQLPGAITGSKTLTC